MTPPSLESVRRDDLLLDLIAARALGPTDDPALALLAALADDVDADLPTTVDPAAVEALAAGFVAATSALGQATPDDVLPLREVPRRRRVLVVRRGVAVAAGVVMVLTSAGVAAAVTGDPAGAFGLRALVAAVTGHTQHATPADPAVQRLRDRIAATARRVPAVSPSEVASLAAEAQRLPDGGGPEVRRELARLRSLLAQASAGVTTAATPAASGVPVSPAGRPSASGSGHEPARSTGSHGHVTASPRGQASGHGASPGHRTRPARGSGSPTTATTDASASTTATGAALVATPSTTTSASGAASGKPSGRGPAPSEPPSSTGPDGGDGDGASSQAVAPR